MELNSYKLLKSCQCGLQTVTDVLNNLNVLKKHNNLNAFKKDALLQVPPRELDFCPFFDDKTQIDLNAYWTSVLLFVAEIFEKDEWRKLALQYYNTIKKPEVTIPT